MSIDLTKISSLLNNVESQSNSTKANTYSINFAEYLLNSMGTQKNQTNIGDDIAAANEVNINNPDSLNAAVQKLIGSNNNTSSSLLDRNVFSSLNGASASSTNSLFNDLVGSANNSTSMQSLYSNTTNKDVIVDALQTNFLTKQMSVMQSAYNKLEANLEQYKIRNAGNDTVAVQARIAEMTKNVSTIQSYMQEKLAEKATNQNLVNQLNAKSQIASLQFK